MNNQFDSLLILVLLIGCAPVRDSPHTTAQVLEIGSTQASGWFDGRGEWALYNNRRDTIRPYQRLERPPTCINVINATNVDRNEFANLNGRYTTAYGRLVYYETLPDAQDAHGRLLSLKIWNGEVVHNSCLNETVFIANRLVLADAN